jgi:glycolate oxidase FAD binding subunit
MSASALRLAASFGLSETPLELPEPERRGTPLEGLPCVAPESEAQLVALVRAAAAERLRLLPLGAGTHLWTAPWPAGAPRPDLGVSLVRFRGLVAHEPGDGTLTARAGTPLAELAAAAASSGQHLTPALGRRRSHATLGGTLAAGQSGWERLRYGPARHHVLGARMLLASGEQVNSGGRLVKNVTGYDLHRLFVGSQGTLGFLLEASLRLFPRPKARARLCLQSLDAETAFKRAAALQALALPLEQLAIGALEPRGNRVRLVAQLAGSPAGLEADLQSARELLPGAALELDPPEPESPWSLAALEPGAEAWLEFSGLPSHGLALWRLLGARLEALGIDSLRVCEPALMRLCLLGPLPSRAAFERLAADLPGLSGSPRWLCREARSLPLAPSAPPGVPLRQRIEQALDPSAMFPKGRLHPAGEARP